MKKLAPYLFIAVFTIGSFAFGAFMLEASAEHDHGHGDHHEHDHSKHDGHGDHSNHSSADAHGDIINNAGEAVGHIDVQQGTEGVVINIEVSNLSPGRHGMHFHKVGDCSDHDHFKSAQGHIENEKPHGFLSSEGPHAGNLPNLIVHDDGSAKVELYSDLVSVSGEKFPLLDEDGSTLIIHTNPDDHLTQPIGGAGARVACSVLKGK